MIEGTINDEIWDEITCTFGNAAHLLEDPVYLKCKKAACLQCLLTFTDENKVIRNCKYCSDRHDLENNISIDFQLKERISNLFYNNKHGLLSFAKLRLKKKFDQIVKETSQNRGAMIANNKKKLEEKLDERINILKDHNDLLYEENMADIQNSKKAIISEIDRLSAANVIVLEGLSKKCSTQRAQIEEDTDEALFQKASEIEYCLKTLSCSSRKATTQINQIHFLEPSVINRYPIGSLNKINVHDPVKKNEEVDDFLSLFNNAKNEGKKFTVIEHLNDLVSTEPIKLSTRYITNDKENNLLVLNLKDNYLYKLNLYGQMVKKYALEVEDVSLNPRGICLNDEGNLFVTNIFNDKIIVYTSNNYEYMMQFGEELSSPRGIECFLDKLYVCDYNNKRIRIFNNQSLIHLNDIHLNQNNEAFFPFNIKIKHDQIIVTDLSNAIRIFSLNDSTHFRTIKDTRIYQPRGLIVDEKQNICICALSDANIYTLYFYGMNGQFKNEFNLTTENVFDISIVRHKYNGDVCFFASVGDHGLILLNIK